MFLLGFWWFFPLLPQLWNHLSDLQLIWGGWLGSCKELVHGKAWLPLSSFFEIVLLLVCLPSEFFSCLTFVLFFFIPIPAAPGSLLPRSASLARTLPSNYTFTFFNLWELNLTIRFVCFSIFGSCFWLHLTQHHQSHRKHLNMIQLLLMGDTNLKDCVSGCCMSFVDKPTVCFGNLSPNAILFPTRVLQVRAAS